MKTRCTQCGGTVEITGPDALARCSWCGAVARLESYSGSFHHVPVLSPEQAERLFPKGSLHPPVLMWFPYLRRGSRLVKAFSQPYPSLEEYEPPSGDLRPWPGSGQPDGEIIPGDASGEDLIYHPFYALAFRDSPDGLLLDAVSGVPAGLPSPGEAGGGESPGRILLWAFLMGLIPSVLVYLLLRKVSPVLAVMAAAPVAYVAAVFLRKLRRNP